MTFGEMFEDGVRWGGVNARFRSKTALRVEAMLGASDREIIDAIPRIISEYHSDLILVYPDWCRGFLEGIRNEQGKLSA